MGNFDVRVFILHCFVPERVRVAESVSVEPFIGIGTMDLLDLIDIYLEDQLNQPTQPRKSKEATSRSIRDQGSSVVVTLKGISANDHIEAIRSTKELLLLTRDAVALRQMQRGTVSGFLSIRNDVSPPNLYVHVRRPYPILRRVHNLPIGESEGEILSAILNEAREDPLLGAYLRLYADSVSYSDTLIDELDLEKRLFKTWSLLEAMAAEEPGTGKAKVKSLFSRHQLSTMPAYKGNEGLDLLDVAYKWRNIVVHNGSCRAAKRNSDRDFCSRFAQHFEDIVEDLSHSCRFLIHAYARWGNQLAS